MRNKIIHLAVKFPFFDAVSACGAKSVPASNIGDVLHSLDPAKVTCPDCLSRLVVLQPAKND